MNIGALIFRRPHQINVVRKIEDVSTSTTTMCECPFFLEVNLIADVLCTFNDRLESLVCNTNCVTRHHYFRIFRTIHLEDLIAHHLETQSHVCMHVRSENAHLWVVICVKMFLTRFCLSTTSRIGIPQIWLDKNCQTNVIKTIYSYWKFIYLFWITPNFILKNDK